MPLMGHDPCVTWFMGHDLDGLSLRAPLENHFYETNMEENYKQVNHTYNALSISSWYPNRRSTFKTKINCTF